MIFPDLQKQLENKLSKQVSRSKIGDVIGTSRQNVNKKFNNPNSEVSVSELLKIEDYFNVKIYPNSNNSMDRQNDVEVSDKFSQIGKRYAEIQGKHNFLDREMAQLLEISEKEYIGIKVGKKEPSIKVLNNTKRNFKVSMDWLMYGEG